jgi:PhnB protein
MSVNPIPAGFHTVAPNIIVKSVDEAVSFYKRAFGAEEILRLSMPLLGRNANSPRVYRAPIRIATAE